MSIIYKLKKNLAIVDEYITKYAGEIEECKDFFNFENKNLEYLCKKLPYYVFQFKSIQGEIKTIEGFLEFEKDKIEGTLFVKYTEKNQRVLGPKEIGMYIKQDPDYVTIMEFILEISQIKYTIIGILDALETYHWQLNNIVKIRVASLEETVL
jgi:ribosomal protein S6